GRGGRPECERGREGPGRGRLGTAVGPGTDDGLRPAPVRLRLTNGRSAAGEEHAVREVLPDDIHLAEPRASERVLVDLEGEDDLLRMMRGTSLSLVEVRAKGRDPFGPLPPPGPRGPLRADLPA